LDAANPNIFMVAGCIAVLMAVLHAAALYKIL
jgi:hypothetical protein